MSYTLRKEEEEEEADGGEILGGTGYGRWGRVFLFSKSTPSCDTNTTQNCCPFLYRSNATKSEVTRFLNVPLDVSDVFLMTFMILLDSYMEPTRVGSDMPSHSADGTESIATDLQSLSYSQSDRMSVCIDVERTDIVSEVVTRRDRVPYAVLYITPILVATRLH